MKYQLRSGKFGFYFYDFKNATDMPLETVLGKLNHPDSLNKNMEQYDLWMRDRSQLTDALTKNSKLEQKLKVALTGIGSIQEATSLFDDSNRACKVINLMCMQLLKD